MAQVTLPLEPGEHDAHRRVARRRGQLRADVFGRCAILEGENRVHDFPLAAGQAFGGWLRHMRQVSHTRRDTCRMSSPAPPPRAGGARRPGRTQLRPLLSSGPAAARTKRAAAILAPLDTIPDYRGASALRTRGGWTQMDVRALLEDVAATYRGLRSLRAEVFSRTESGDTNEG